MRRKTTLEHIDQLVLDFGALAEASLAAGAPKAAAPEPTLAAEPALAPEPTLQPAPAPEPSPDRPTLAEVLSSYPKDRPLDRPAAEAVGPHPWSDFLAALGRKPGQEALVNARTRFMQAVEVLSDREPSVNLWERRLTCDLDADAKPSDWAEGWKLADIETAKLEARFAEARAASATPELPKAQVRLERDAASELGAADPETDAAAENILQLENFILEGGAVEAPEEGVEAEAPDVRAGWVPRVSIVEAYDPVAELYEKFKRENRPAYEAAAGGKPVSEFTAEDLMVRDASGEPAIFGVILDGRAGELAPGAVTEEVCLAADEYGNNAAHQLARYCGEPPYCGKIPEAFQGALTEAVLSAPEAFNHRTPAHEFAAAGMLGLLPEEALTEAMLTTPDDCGKTAQDYAEEAGDPNLAGEEEGRPQPEHRIQDQGPRL